MRRFYKNPKNIVENYANSIYLSDRDLSEFFIQLNKRAYLKNSIVIITGDHSFPLGEHGISSNESGFYNEFFNTPLLLIWKNKLKAERVKEILYSQVDIAPTILDLIGINNIRNHFVGKSIFRKPRKQDAVYLIQPYSGTYLAVLDYPYKFTKHLKTGEMYLFNLKEDPGEIKNLISATNPEIIKKFEEKLKVIFLNQKLIENNEIWKENN